MRTLKEVLALVVNRLRRSGVESPRLSAELLLCAALGLERIGIVLHPEQVVDAAGWERLEGLCARCEAGEPLAYLTGVRDFYGRDFCVNSATLIPRPETELLVERALSSFGQERLRFVDFGTGSGCLAVTLCAERSGWQGIALDISGEALRVAAQNSVRYHTDTRLMLCQGDFCAPPLSRGSVHLVVANPPYIGAREHAQLERNVRDFEPREALSPGADGLLHVRCIVRVAAAVLQHGGLLLMEHGYDQGAEVAAYCEELGMWKAVRTEKDWAGLDRYVCAWRD